MSVRFLGYGPGRFQQTAMRRSRRRVRWLAKLDSQLLRSEHAQVAGNDPKILSLEEPWSRVAAPHQVWQGPARGTGLTLVDEDYFVVYAIDVPRTSEPGWAILLPQNFAGGRSATRVREHRIRLDALAQSPFWRRVFKKSWLAVRYAGNADNYQTGSTDGRAQIRTIDGHTTSFRLPIHASTFRDGMHHDELQKKPDWVPLWAFTGFVGKIVPAIIAGTLEAVFYNGEIWLHASDGAEVRKAIEAAEIIRTHLTQSVDGAVISSPWDDRHIIEAEASIGGRLRAREWGMV